MTPAAELSARRVLAALALAAVVAACQRSEPVPGRQQVPEPPAATPAGASPSAAGFDTGEVKTTQDYLAEARFAAADFERGRILSLSCQACHTLKAGEDHNLGPNLYGIFGSRAGRRAGFQYSDVLRNSGLVWTPESLEAWLAEPADFIPGNNMAFAGFRSEKDRRDLLAYLLRATSGLDR